MDLLKTDSVSDMHDNVLMMLRSKFKTDFDSKNEFIPEGTEILD